MALGITDFPLPAERFEPIPSGHFRRALEEAGPGPSGANPGGSGGDAGAATATGKLRDFIEAVLTEASSANGEEIRARIAEFAASGADLSAGDVSGEIGLLQLVAMHDDPTLYDAMLEAIPEGQRAAVLNARWDGGNTVMHALAFRHPDRYAQAKAAGGDGSIVNEGGHSADAIAVQHKKRILPLLTAGSVAAATGAGVAIVSAGIIVGLGAIAFALYRHYQTGREGLEGDDLENSPASATPTRPTTSPFEGGPTATFSPVLYTGPADNPAASTEQGAPVTLPQELLELVLTGLQGEDLFQTYRDFAAFSRSSRQFNAILAAPGPLQRQFATLRAQVRDAGLAWDRIIAGSQETGLTLHALDDLAPLWRYVSPARREAAFDRILGVAPPQVQASLLRSGVLLTTRQFEELRQEAFAGNSGDLLGSLGWRLDRMNEDQQTAWLDAVFALDSFDIRQALHAMRGGLENLSEAMQARLVDAAMFNVDSYGEEPAWQFQLMRLLMEDPGQLDETQRSRVIGQASRLFQSLRDSNPTAEEQEELDGIAAILAQGGEFVDPGLQQQALMMAVAGHSSDQFGLLVDLVRSWGHANNGPQDERPEGERTPAHRHDLASPTVALVDRLMTSAEMMRRFNRDGEGAARVLTTLAGWAPRLDEDQLNWLLDILQTLDPAHQSATLQALLPHLAAFDDRAMVGEASPERHAAGSLIRRIVDAMLSPNGGDRHRAVVLLREQAAHLDADQRARLNEVTVEEEDAMSDASPAGPVGWNEVDSDDSDWLKRDVPLSEHERDLQDQIERGDIGFRELFELRFRDGNGRPEWSDALTRTVDEHLRSEHPSTEDMEALRVDILRFGSKWTNDELQAVLDSGVTEGEGLGRLKETIAALFYEQDFRNMPSDQQYDEALDALAGYIAGPMKSQQFLPELDDTAKGHLADVIKYHLFHLKPQGGDRQKSALAVRYHHGDDYLMNDIPGIVADRLKEIFGKGGKGAGEVVEDWFEDEGSDAHEAMKELITREYDGYVAYANWHYGGPDSPALRLWER